MSKKNSPRTLLVIDDDKLFCDMVSRYFSGSLIKVFIANTAADGLRMNRERKMDVVLLDQKLPDGRGVDLCRPLLERNEKSKIIFNTAYPSFNNAVEAIKAGAYDYLSKPFELEEMELSVNRALKTLDLEKVEQVHKYTSDKEKEKNVFVGKQRGLENVQKLIELAAFNDAAVLITGETGTGKGVVARAIHYLASTADTVFLSTNCGALPENLIEAELFGTEKGAYTGADVSRKGIFEMAEGGTLFLDEIGTLPFLLQSKLLGVLDDREIRRLGGSNVIPINTRIIAATNMDLEEAIREKHFREDLYYRLCVMRIHIPPLRERPHDIAELSHHFIKKFTPQLGLELSGPELEALEEYHWPGNVRELKNIIERSIILRSGASLQPSKLLQKQSQTPVAESQTLNRDSQQTIATLKEIEKQHIQNTLSQLSNNISKTSMALGISRSTLKRKINSYGLVRSGLK